MCYRKNICPLYNPSKGTCEACERCEHLKNARISIRNARIGLAVAVIVYIITTVIIGNAYFI